MESMLPSDIRSALGRETGKARATVTGLTARSGDGRTETRHGVVELTDAGMVIRAEETPHLRGFVDILKGDERIGRHLVVLSWTRDGLAGYEFKRGGHAGPAPADYERPVHAGLLGGPSSG
jgi:hypothetical protein